MDRPTIHGLSAAYKEGSRDPVEVAQDLLTRIEDVNSESNWFITILKSSALRSAQESAARYKAGEQLGPLDGAPIAVKDIVYIDGVRCTAGSKILSNNVAKYDAPVVRKLKALGAVILGTTNLHEFAAGVTSDNPHYGPVRNPWSRGRVAGGSSGGSAAAVAAGLAAAALGTDTAGSVRIPAALCGVVGLKPTYGLVSRLGVVPLAPSLDTVGVLSTDSTDAALVLDAISGHEEGDITTGELAHENVAEHLHPQGNHKVGVPRAFYRDKVDQRLEKNFDGFLAKLREIGCEVVEIGSDWLEETYGLWLPIRRAEATAFHLKWLDSTPDLYGRDVRQLLELGRDVKAVDYVNSLNARPGMIEKALLSMKDVDLVVLPTTCVPAPPIGDEKVTVDGREVEVYKALNRLTLPFNYLGFPSVSVPSGAIDGLPVGAQIVSKLFDESTALSLGLKLDSTFGPYPSPLQ